MPKKMAVKTERVVYSYSVMRTSSWHFYDIAKNNENGRFYNCMASMLFSAFSLEAYLNHLGDIRLIDWGIIEPKLSPKEKLIVITNKIGFRPNYGSRPYQTFDEIFKFRNRIAHARTEKLKNDFEAYLEFSDEPDLPYTKWEEMIDLDQTEKFFTDSKDVIKDLNTRAGFKQDPFFTDWTGQWSMG